MLWARILADLIVVVHAAWVLFIVLGQLLILLGLALRWGWVRNLTFRIIHLGMIGIVVLEEAIGMACPLTVWEARLRRLGGEEAYRGDFLGYWAHRLIFVEAPPWAFTLVYVLFAGAVLATFALAPPRRGRAGSGGASDLAGRGPAPENGPQPPSRPSSEATPSRQETPPS